MYYHKACGRNTIIYLAPLIHKLSPKVLWYRIIVVTLQTNKEVLPLQRIMETSDNSIELQIAAVLSNIRQKGYSAVLPFRESSISKIEKAGHT